MRLLHQQLQPTGANRWIAPCRCRTNTQRQAIIRAQAFTPASFIPATYAQEITEPAARTAITQYTRIDVDCPSFPAPVRTAVIPPTNTDPSKPPLVALHGFDSSSLEFRRLLPLLQDDFRAWGVDLVGWGFTACGFEDPAAAQGMRLGPEEKRAHLYAFWKQHIKEPMVLMGTSLGATIAIDFAIAHPEAVSKLVLLCPQVNSDGVPTLPRPLAWLGVKVLQTVPLRQYANTMAYYDDNTYATNDALLCGRLHTHLPGWVDMNIAFIASGGYRIVGRLKEVTQPTLVVWGRHDEILNPKDADGVVGQLECGRLVWAESSGHCPHLEEPSFTAAQVAAFVGAEQPEGVAAA